MIFSISADKNHGFLILLMQLDLQIFLKKNIQHQGFSRPEIMTSLLKINPLCLQETEKRGGGNCHGHLRAFPDTFHKVVVQNLLMMAS